MTNKELFFTIVIFSILWGLITSCGEGKSELKTKSWEGVVVENWGFWIVVKPKTSDNTFGKKQSIDIPAHRYRRVDGSKLERNNIQSLPEAGDWIVVKYNPIFENYTYMLIKTNLLD